MKSGVSILFNAYSHFHNDLSATLGCPTGCGLPQPQFQTNLSRRKAQLGHRPMGQHASGFHTVRVLSRIEQILIIRL